MAAALPEVARFLLDPRAYPEQPGRVALIQTQMSFVFLGGKYAYKLKKPVDLGYLDYTTVEKRRFLCDQEVRLNRRLCPGSYLGVIPVTRRGTDLSLGGQGEIIDWVIKMFRLPAERMLDFLLVHDRVNPSMIKRLAGKLAEFHAKTDSRPAASPFGQIADIRFDIEENFAQTQKYIDITITSKQYRQIKEFSLEILREKTALFNERVASGHIKECHGDLHAAHICFTDGICIFDCIEFNDRFRFIDTIADIAFLAMDLDHYGRADLSRSFIDIYSETSRDWRIPDLLNFYKCYRAYVRGKVESFRSEDPYVSSIERKDAIAAARSYFGLAELYSREIVPSGRIKF